MAPLTFTSEYISIGSRKAHVRLSRPALTHLSKEPPPIIFLHGLGGSSSFWISALLTIPELAERRLLVLYDLDGHGMSTWSGRDLNLDGLVEDLAHVMRELKIKRAALAGHCFSALVASLYALRAPASVEKLFFLNPIRRLSSPVRKVVVAQAAAVLTSSGMSAVAGSISASSISRRSLESDYSAQSFIHRMLLTTNAKGFSAGSEALLQASPFDASKVTCNTLIVGGTEDVFTPPDLVRSWANEIGDGKGRDVILRDVGHWGAIEAPREVGELLEDWDAM